MYNISSQFSALVHKISESKGPDFSGLGLIFYSPPIEIPSFALGDSLPPGLKLPLRGIDSIASLLIEISANDSNWHDGFHLINYRDFSLTHICQFLSPPPASIPTPKQGSLPIGARQMSALAISKLISVELIILISSNGEIHIFSNGERVS